MSASLDAMPTAATTNAIQVDGEIVTSYMRLDLTFRYVVAVIISSAAGASWH